jgi:glycine betaine/proline transport system substrate-binding protein
MNYRNAGQLVTCLVACMNLGFAQASVPEISTPVRISFINSSDSDFIAAVYGQALKQAGYEVKYVTVDSAAQYTAVQTGDIDATLGAWQTTGVEMTKAAMASGKVNNYGPTGVKVTEGWWYPDYLKQFCPGLPAFDALKQPKCAEALATADTKPKARFVDAPADWGSRSDVRITTYQLPFNVINSGSPSALLATFQGAIDRKQPILGWMFTPNWFTEKNPGEFVQFPDTRLEVDVLKLGNKQAYAAIPVAEKILQKFTLDKQAVAAAMDKIDNDGSSPEDEADAWIASHKDVVQGWSK